MDDAARSRRLRVGVVGLGRLWESRHKPSLARRPDRFQVTAVYDQVARRAEIEAGQLGCAACDGVASLIARPDVDVVYLTASQWFGPHAAFLAREAGKPVYCALPLAGDLDELERLAARVDESGVVFTPEFARRCYPATTRLRDLLATTLGRPRLIVGQSWISGYDRYAQPGPGTRIASAPLAVDPGGYLLDWCAFVLGADPTAVSAAGARVLSRRATAGDDRDLDFDSFTARFPDGATAQVSFGLYHRGEWGEADRFLPPSGFQVFAERGAAWVEMPDRVRWWDAEGPHEERLPVDPTVGDVLNDQFYRLVVGEPSAAPTIQDALAVARLVAALERGRAEAD